MNDTECRQIAKRIKTMCRHEWADDKLKDFALTLWRSSIGGIAFGVVNDSLTRMFAEVDADEITVPRLIEGVKTRPVVPERLRLPEPVVLGESPTERGIRWAERNGIPAPAPRMQERALMADRLLRIGRAMNTVCRRCRRPMSDDDLLAYIHDCMDAGAKALDEPERICIACRPEPDVGDDVAVPF